MGSFGQGVIGQTHIGGAPPYDIYFPNIGEVLASQPVIRLSADAHCQYEHIWFDARISYGVALDETYHHPADPQWDPQERIPTQIRGGEVELHLPFALDATKTYTLTVRATTDPELSDWWFVKAFSFQPVVGDVPAVDGFFLYESRAKEVVVLVNGTSQSSVPYATWTKIEPCDYFRWNITIDAHNNNLPHATMLSEIDFTDYPLYDGWWYIKVAKIVAGVIGPVFSFRFEVEGTDIIVT